MNKQIFLDIETTGFSREWDSVIELAAIYVENGIVVDEFHQYCKPRRKIPAKIEELTGITNAQVSNCPDEDIVLMDFTEWLALHPCGEIIAHNGKAFDIPFITARCSFYRLSLPFQNTTIIDTLALARAANKSGAIKVENCKQPTLATYFGIVYDAHSAIEDTKALMKIYNCLSQTEEDIGF